MFGYFPFVSQVSLQFGDKRRQMGIFCANYEELQQSASDQSNHKKGFGVAPSLW